MTRRSEVGERTHRAVRERILRTASELFYAHGARAIGIDLIIERSGVAKMSLYRHFRSKDELVAAFLEDEDRAFFETWDVVAARHGSDAWAELEAQFAWIAERLARPGYRGCPQLNTAAEFSDPMHPARIVATSHARRLAERLEAIATKLDARVPRELAVRLLVLVNGAFASSGAIDGVTAGTLCGAARALVADARQTGCRDA